MIAILPSDTAAMVAHAEKLASLTRCPACGALRDEQSEETAFVCTGVFRLAHGEIIVDTPCPTGSHVAARHLNAEVATETGIQNHTQPAEIGHIVKSW